MLFERMDHLIVPIANLGTALEPFERLGLALGPILSHSGRGTESVLFGAGDETAFFQVELTCIVDEEVSLRVRGRSAHDAAAQQRPIALVLGSEDLDGAVAVLRAGGLSPDVRDVAVRAVSESPQPESQGVKASRVADLNAPAEATAPLRAIQYPLSTAERLMRFRAHATAPNPFPLKRLDHLAAFTRNLEVSTRFWTDVMGVPLHGEVRTSAIIIRQIKIGDAILELLGAVSAESPAAQRQPGLLNMAAFEVADMAGAVAQARAAGFTVPDPAPGPLPGTRVTTIPAAEFGGFSLQLLEYV